MLERREKTSSATLLRSFVEQLPPRSNFVHNLLPAKDSRIEGYLCCFRQIGRMDLRDTRAEDALHPRIVVVEVLGELLGYRVRVEDRVCAEPRPFLRKLPIPYANAFLIGRRSFISPELFFQHP